MSKKLFSIFITSFIAISGVVMVPSDTEALSFAPTPDCRVEGVVIEALFKEFKKASPGWSGGDSPEQYQFLVHITGTELLGDAHNGDCPDFHKISYNQYYSFPSNVLPSGMTAHSIRGYFVSFKAGRGGSLATDFVLTPRPGQVDFCTVEGILVNTPFNSAHLCMPTDNSPCFNDESFDIQITKVQGINNHCGINFPVGSKTSISLRSTNLLNKQNFTLEKGSKIRISGALETGSSMLRSLHGLVLASPKPDEKEEPKKPDEPKEADENDQEDQDELTPVLDTPIEPTKTTTDSNFLVGILVGLLVGLAAVVITYLVKRKHK
jgi:hypothetical protein